MILLSDNLRIGLITGHIPISKVAESITPELIQDKVDIFAPLLSTRFQHQ